MEERVPLSVLDAALDECRRDGASGHLDAATNAEHGDLDVFGYAMATAPTVEQALAFAGEKGSLLLRGGTHRFERAAHEGTLSLSLPRGLHHVHRRSVEHAIALLMTLLERASGAQLEPTAIAWQHEDDDIDRVLRQFFRSPIRFGAERTSVGIRSADLGRPLERSDGALHGILARYAGALHRAADPDDLISRARHAMLDVLEADHSVDLERTARSLAVSPRSLQRKLREASTTFQELSNQVRRDVALSLLGDSPMDLAEIADFLGFTSMGAFRAAMKRWTGKPPSAFRHGTR